MLGFFLPSDHVVLDLFWIYTQAVHSTVGSALFSWFWIDFFFLILDLFFSPPLMWKTRRVSQFRMQYVQLWSIAAVLCRASSSASPGFADISWEEKPCQGFRSALAQHALPWTAWRYFSQAACQVDHSLLGVWWVSAQDLCRALWSATPSCSVKIGKGSCCSDGIHWVSDFKWNLEVQLSPAVCVISLQNWFLVFDILVSTPEIVKKQLLVFDAALEFYLHYSSSISLEKGSKVTSYWHIRKKIFIKVFCE